jgi:hypothetical protein
MLPYYDRRVNRVDKQPRVHLNEMDIPGHLQNAESPLLQLSFNANSFESPGPFLPVSVHANTMHCNTWQPPHSDVLPFVNQPSPIPSEYSTPLGTSQSTSRGRKRKQDENLYPAEAATPPASVPRKKRKSLLSIDQKLAIVYNAINKEANWSFSEFIFYFFRDKDEHGNPVHREQSHASTVQRFQVVHLISV